MTGKTRRRTVFINKRFQTGFSIKFLVLIAAESLLAIALFLYISSGTFTTGYTGADIVVARTGEYFLPTVLLVNLVLIGSTAIAGFAIMLYTSHKIAGPLYRFEKSLEEIGGGDLTHRFSLRGDDQLGELAEKLNDFNTSLDMAVHSIQESAAGFDAMLAEVSQTLEKTSAEDGPELEALRERLKETKRELEGLKKTAGFFKTSAKPEIF